MLIANGLVADSEQFRNMPASAQVLDYLQERVGSFGATHFLATGLPLPGRPLEPLILRIEWGDLRGASIPLGEIDPNDPMLRIALVARRAFLRFGRREHERMAMIPG